MQQRGCWGNISGAPITRSFSLQDLYRAVSRNLPVRERKPCFLVMASVVFLITMTKHRTKATRFHFGSKFDGTVDHDREGLAMRA